MTDLQHQSWLRSTDDWLWTPSHVELFSTSTHEQAWTWSKGKIVPARFFGHVDVRSFYLPSESVRNLVPRGPFCHALEIGPLGTRLISRVRAQPGPPRSNVCACARNCVGIASFDSKNPACGCNDGCTFLRVRSEIFFLLQWGSSAMIGRRKRNLWHEL